MRLATRRSHRRRTRAASVSSHASAILALTYPEKYAVIDFRGWRQVFGEQKSSFSLADYKRYLRAVRKLAETLEWSVQETDAAIWEYDRRLNNSKG